MSRVDQFVELLGLDQSHGLDPEQIRRVATTLAFGGAGTPDEVSEFALADLGSASFCELAADVEDFVLKVFGSQSAEASALKCQAEAVEFAESPTVEEAADVLITLLAWCVYAGVSAPDLVSGAAAKMRRNRKRTWSRQPNGTFQHVVEAS